MDSAHARRHNEWVRHVVASSLAILDLACGRLGFDVDDGAASEPVGPYDVAAPLPGVNTASDEDDPSLTDDLLEIFFDSNRAGGMGGGDLWVATRADESSAFSVPTNVGALNTPGDESSPYVSGEGLTLYWVASGVSGGRDIYVAARSTRQSAWSAPRHLPELSSPGEEFGPALSADGLTLYFTSDVGGNHDIYVSARDLPTGGWNAPAKVAELATMADEHEPWIGTTTIVFSSTRPGGAGASDLWFARRVTPTAPFDMAMPLAEIDTNRAESDPWLSPDEHTIVFTRDNDIYFALR